MPLQAETRLQPTKAKTARWVSIAIVMAVGGAVGAPLVRDAIDRRLVEYWNGQLTGASDTQAAPIAKRVARLGPPGLPLLVSALASPRGSVSGAARSALLEEVGRWTSQPSAESALHALVLAESLADSFDQIPPSGRLLASDLCQRLLARPFDRDISRQGRLTAACEAVLRASLRERLAEERGRNAQPVSPSNADDTVPGDTLDRVDTLDGLGLVPVSDVAPARTGSAVDAGISRLGSSSGKSRRMLRWEQPGEPSDDTDQDAVAARVPLVIDGAPAADAPFVSPDAATSPAEPSDAPLRVGAMEIAAPDEPLVAQPEQPDGDAAILSAMRRLHDPKPEVARGAVEELRQRGFGVEELNLARRFAHPDAERRMAFARSLAQPAAFDRRRWLYWLLDDANADVRWEAFSLLATTGDPQVLRELEQRAQRDSDGRIRKEIDRLQKQRTATSSGLRR